MSSILLRAKSSTTFSPSFHQVRKGILDFTICILSNHGSLLVKRAYDTNVPDKVGNKSLGIWISLLIHASITRFLKKTFGNVSWLLNSFTDRGRGRDPKWQRMMISLIDVYKRKMMVMNWDENASCVTELTHEYREFQSTRTFELGQD